MGQVESVFFDENHEQRVVSLYNDMRDEEYQEFINECEKYIKELAKEISIKKFTFAELEEEEEELQKLIKWHSKIEVRDIFQSSERKAASDMLKKIENDFENYSNLVYQNTEKGD